MEQFIGLKAKKCAPCEGGGTPLSDVEVEGLRQQVGWKVVTAGDKGIKAIRHEWKVRNFVSALELFKRFGEVAEAEGHHPDLHLESFNHVRVELSTHSAGGLTLNDFILAAKLNDVEITDLMPKRKPKFWA